MDTLIQQILDLYTAAEIELLQRIAKYTNGGDEVSNEAWLNQKLANIRALRREAYDILLKLKDADAIAQQLIIAEYLTGAGNKPASFISTNTDTVNALVGEYTGALKSTRIQILRQTEDAYKRIVYDAVTQSALGVQPRLQTANASLNKLAQEGIAGFVDKSGRQWDMRSYVEAATRSSLANAAREGKFASIVADGDDLIIVRTSPRYCEKCTPWKNKILSISGNSNKYPALNTAKEAGLYHVNCRCTAAKYISGLTKVDVEEAITNNYPSEQKQRYYERKMRGIRRVLAIDPTNDKAQQRLQNYRAKLVALVEEENLTRKTRRENNISPR